MPQCAASTARSSASGSTFKAPATPAVAAGGLFSPGVAALSDGPGAAAALTARLTGSTQCQ